MGSATITAGNTNVVVSHGQSFTPTIDQIWLQPQDDLGGREYFPSNPTSTTFQINISFADPDTAHNFSWQILVAGSGGVQLPPAQLPITFPINVTDVQTQLNAAFDGVGTYTVYGLTITLASVQAQVDYANQYITGMLSSAISSSDPRYVYARQAAIDLACIRTLVIASGGSLTGAYDYFLGDLRVTRAGPYANAIKNTIAGLQADLTKQLVNFSTPVMTADAAAAQQVPTYRGDVIGP
ncbi:MAG: hypothetical protein ABSB89_05225 [Candidatus Bathyarchaeia archaeon]|jgi:hypothetical protein